MRGLAHRQRAARRRGPAPRFRGRRTRRRGRARRSCRRRGPRRCPPGVARTDSTSSNTIRSRSAPVSASIARAGADHAAVLVETPRRSSGCQHRQALGDLGGVDLIRADAGAAHRLEPAQPGGAERYHPVAREQLPCRTAPPTRARRDAPRTRTRPGAGRRGRGGRCATRRRTGRCRGRRARRPSRWRPARSARTPSRARRFRPRSPPRRRQRSRRHHGQSARRASRTPPHRGGALSRTRCVEPGADRVGSN